MSPPANRIGSKLDGLLPKAYI